MTENIIVVALVAIATIGVVSLYGNNLRALFGAAAGNLAGVQGANNGTTAGTGQVEKGLGDFAQGGGADTNRANRRER
jgi:Flp pilus assembly pilin Flp